MIAAPVACASCGDELAADDQRLLVGEREVDPLAERRDRRQQARRADDRVQHQVALALGDQPDDAVRPRQHLAARPRLARPRGGVGIGQRDLAHAVRAGLRRPAAPTSSAALSATTVSSGERETTSSAWTPIEPVEPRIARRRGTGSV